MTEEKKSKNYPSEITPPENLNDKDLNNPERGERIAKYLARLGVASRRDIEKMIDQKRIVVNGDIVTTPASFVTERDQIQVDGDNVGRRQQPRLFMYHKPAGLITTAKDPEGRFLFVNQAMASSLLGACDTNEPLGRTDAFFAQRECAAHPDDAQ